MKKAGIDIGSNSILLLIADVTNSKVEPIHEEYFFPRLGKGVAESGMLSLNRMEKAEIILRNILKVAAYHDCSRIIAAATAAVREARNGGEFTDRIKSHLNLPIHIINGEEEAELTYLGAVSTGVDKDEKLVVLDIGGGSTETTLGVGDCPAEVMSAPIGAVKLFDNYGKNPGLVPDAGDLIDRQIGAAARSSRGNRLIAVGGTATTLAAVLMKMTRYDAEKLEGSTLSIDDVRKCIDLFRELTVEEIRGLPGMEPGRADIIEAGATILLRFMEIGGHEELALTARGLRYGLVLRY